MAAEDKVCEDCARPDCGEEKFCGQGNFLEKAIARLDHLSEIKPSRKAHARTISFLTDWFKLSTWSPPFIIVDVNIRGVREQFRPVILSWLNWDRNNRVIVTLYRAGTPCKVQIQESNRDELTLYCDFNKAADFQKLLMILNDLVACINPPQSVRSQIDLLLAEDPIKNSDMIKLCREMPETGYRLAFLKIATG